MVSESAFLVFIATTLVLLLGFIPTVSGCVSTPIQNFVDPLQSYSFVTKWGSYGSGDGQFVDPEHLTVDSEGNVYVSDRHNNNIQVFKPLDNTKNINSTGY